MATAAKVTGSITRWWWVRHAPVPNPEGRCYGQTDKDCDVSNEALFKHLGVDELISPTRMILGSIEQDIPVNELLHLGALGSGELELHRAVLDRGNHPPGTAVCAFIVVEDFEAPPPLLPLEQGVLERIAHRRNLSQVGPRRLDFAGC